MSQLLLLHNPEAQNGRVDRDHCQVTGVSREWQEHGQEVTGCSITTRTVPLLLGFDVAADTFLVSTGVNPSDGWGSVTGPERGSSLPGPRAACTSGRWDYQYSVGNLRHFYHPGLPLYGSLGNDAPQFSAQRKGLPGHVQDLELELGNRNVARARSRRQEARFPSKTTFLGHT